MSFFQDPPLLGNQYRDDRALRGCLRRLLPPDVLAAITPQLEHMGELAAGELLFSGADASEPSARLAMDGG